MEVLRTTVTASPEPPPPENATTGTLVKSEPAEVTLQLATGVGVRTTVNVTFVPRTEVSVTPVPPPPVKPIVGALV
jgi:hypothetical protein